jgi:hypothetical protein
MSTTPNAILTTFGLADYEHTLAAVFELTHSYIGSSAALYWHLSKKNGTPIPDDLSLALFCDLRNVSLDESAVETIFDAIFRAAGYTHTSPYYIPASSAERRIYGFKNKYIWIHSTLGRKIKLYVRSKDTPADAPPLYALGAFDINQMYVKWYAGRYLSIFYSITDSDITNETFGDITKFRMRVGKLKNLELAHVLYHLNKHYSRGFAIVEERDTPCSCACGHEHTVKKDVRLTLEEAIVYVTAKHRTANPPADDTLRPPPLEIPPILEIRDVEMETPPRPKRLIRKDDAWIRPKPEE